MHPPLQQVSNFAHNIADAIFWECRADAGQDLSERSFQIIVKERVIFPGSLDLLTHKSVLLYNGLKDETHDVSKSD
jgi:hypothetical protein